MYATQCMHTGGSDLITAPPGVKIRSIKFLLSTHLMNLDLCLLFKCIDKRRPSRGSNNVYVYEPQQKLGRGSFERKTGLRPPPQVTYH